MQHYQLGHVIGGPPGGESLLSGVDYEGPSMACIDLRPDGTGDGRCLIATPERLGPGHGRYLGDNLDELSKANRAGLASDLGVAVAPAKNQPGLRHLIADLLIRHGNDARKDRWNQLKPDLDGFHRIHLGELIYEVPVLKALSLSDSMTRADNADINVGAPLTWGNSQANAQINSNVAKNVSTTTALCRAETDLATADHFSQGTLFLVITVGGAAGVMVRCNAANQTHYRCTVQQNSQVYQVRKSDATGTTLAVVFKTSSVVPTNGKVIRLEITGSSITSYLDYGGTPDTQTATDTTITGNTRAGFGVFGTGSANRQGISNWSAGDLGGAAPSPTGFLLFF